MQAVLKTEYSHWILLNLSVLFFRNTLLIETRPNWDSWQLRPCTVETVETVYSWDSWDRLHSWDSWQLRRLRSIERFRTLKAKCWMGRDGTMLKIGKWQPRRCDLLNYLPSRRVVLLAARMFSAQKTIIYWNCLPILPKPDWHIVIPNGWAMCHLPQPKRHTSAGILSVVGCSDF